MSRKAKRRKRHNSNNKKHIDIYIIICFEENKKDAKATLPQKIVLASAIIGLISAIINLMLRFI